MFTLCLYLNTLKIRKEYVMKYSKSARRVVKIKNFLFWSFEVFPPLDLATKTGSMYIATTDVGLEKSAMLISTS